MGMRLNQNFLSSDNHHHFKRNKTNTEKYEIGKVYVLPKHLDEKVARLHLEGVQGLITHLQNIKYCQFSAFDYQIGSC